MKIYYKEHPALELKKDDVNWLLKNGFIIIINNRYTLNPEHKELHYIFSGKTPKFKVQKYLEHMNETKLVCEDCGKPYSFHVRPYIEQDGSINFKKIVNVCKDCRTKLLSKKDILIPQFKKRINWKEENQKIEKMIEVHDIKDKYEFRKLSRQIVRIERFIKLVLPPINTNDLNSEYNKVMEEFKNIIKNNLGDDIKLDADKKRIIKSFLSLEARSRCPVCGNKVSDKDWTLDHIVALDLGGVNKIENYIGMCRKCNKEKDNLPVLEFLCSVELKRMPTRLLVIAHHQQQEIKIKLELLKEEQKSYFSK